jgi:hypothetical protein
MSDFTPDRGGQVNSAGDTRALYLKLFAGEVLNKLAEVRSTAGMTLEKTLRGGKSHQFPYTGTLTPAYHQAGTELTGQSGNNAEKVISLDDLLVVDRFTPKIDKWLSHFDDRQEYARQMSEVLGITMDRHVLNEGILGARSGSIVTGNGAAGLQISNDKFKLNTAVSANAQTNVQLAEAYRAALKAAAAQFKQKNVPAGIKKVCYVDWDVYFSILDAVDTNGFSLFNKDYASGSLEEGMLPPVYGIHIKGTNNLSITDTSGLANAQAGTDFFHKGNFSKTVGLIMCERSVATVKASDISIEADPYTARHKGQLVTADYFAGHGFIRPEMLVELNLIATSN